MPSLSMSIQGYLENVTPASVFSLKRAGTASTKRSTSTQDSSTAYSYFQSYFQDDHESGASTFSYDSNFTSRCSTGTMERTVDTEFGSYGSGRTVDEETLPSLSCVDENRIVEDDRSEYDRVIDTNTKNRSLSLAWERNNTVASSFRTVNTCNQNSVAIDACELPEGISKSDITVTIDIDDEARSSRVPELDEDLDREIRRKNRRTRRKFEESVRQNILDDLKSLYTATPRSAKYVLCVVISVLSDGTLDHTFWSGGRVGLTEINLQWVMFNADDLQVYKRGRVVQKKDFGFGPLELTEHEGQHYLSTTLVPRAINEIVSSLGGGAGQDLLVEI